MYLFQQRCLTRSFFDLFIDFEWLFILPLDSESLVILGIYFFIALNVCNVGYEDRFSCSNILYVNK